MLYNIRCRRKEETQEGDQEEEEEETRGDKKCIGGEADGDAGDVEDEEGKKYCRWR